MADAGDDEVVGEIPEAVAVVEVDEEHKQAAEKAKEEANALFKGESGRRDVLRPSCGVEEFWGKASLTLAQPQAGAAASSAALTTATADE